MFPGVVQLDGSTRGPSLCLRQGVILADCHPSFEQARLNNISIRLQPRCVSRDWHSYFKV